MKQHWKILLWMLAGVLIGGVLQFAFEARPHSGLSFVADAGQPEIRSKSGLALRSKLAIGDRVSAVTLHKGRSALERRIEIASVEAFRGAVDQAAVGDVIWVEVQRQGRARSFPLSLDMEPDSPRRSWLAPFDFLANIFLQLLKMLIVPLVLTSIISGVAGVGTGNDLRRMGLKTFAYYVSTSLLAILVGQVLVNLIQPGKGAELGLPPRDEFAELQSENFLDILLRMVPENFFSALSDNGAMLQIIFFGLVFGVAITRTPDPHRGRVQGFFESAFEVMMRLAEMVLKLIPYGVFCLLVRVVGETGFGLFAPLAWYCVTIVSALTLHAVVILPLILLLVARVSPLQWVRVMGPALLTAFSASSSSMTLPVSMECVEKRGGVSNKTSSFVLPLGATINMDGTALYECAGVIFLAQYYQSIGGFELTFGGQAQVVLLALLASIGAAGIPSAGLVMMLTILSALELPLEGAALLLAVDRPLDMMRTAVNVWSDSVGTAVLARTEGEVLPASLGAQRQADPPGTH